MKKTVAFCNNCGKDQKPDSVYSKKSIGPDISLCIEIADNQTYHLCQDCINELMNEFETRLCQALGLPNEPIKPEDGMKRLCKNCLYFNFGFPPSEHCEPYPRGENHCKNWKVK